MNKFRANTPQKRDINTIVLKYQKHKGDLKIDFNSRCGYCDDHDSWRNTYYEIDHFVPTGYLTKEEKKEYKNLVYSCRYCNNSKRAKWPTKDKDKSNDGKQGFVEPWIEEYSKLFTRDSKGRIKSNSDLGNWIIKNLNLGLKRHSILWQIDRLTKVVEEIRAFYEDKDSIDPKIEFLLEYIDLNKKLRDN